MTPESDYRLIPLTQGQFAKVSPHRFEELNQWKWQAQWDDCTKSFYATRRETLPSGKRIKIALHRQILGLEFGDKREGDHKNHDTLDNTDDNLRVATHHQNFLSCAGDPNGMPRSSLKVRTGILDAGQHQSKLTANSTSLQP